MTVVIKTASEPKSVLASARAQLQALDPAQPIFDVRTLSEIRDRSVASQRVNVVLLGLFAAAGLGLAVIGLYGLLAFTVEQRTREIGVRMALGARLADVRQLVVGQGMVLVLLGSAFGLAGALALTQALRSLLFAVKPIDPLTFVVAPAVLLAATVAACWIPASRAARVDPMEALRHE
jgi:ABC-type antimicrobial peptide transport system permease subunit